VNSVFAIDVGGTAVKTGLVARGGTFLAKDSFAFDRGLDFEAFVDRLAARGSDLARAAGVEPWAVAVATPGYSDPATGELLDGAGNVPVLRGRSLRAALADRLGLPAVCANDGVAAALGELEYGAGRRFRRFALMTFGTGVGGAVVIDGVPVTGPRGEPPELGAIAVGDVPAAGPAPSLERRAASAAFLRAYGEGGGDDVEALFRLVRSGDARAAAAVDAVSRHIAQAAGSLINALGLEALVIGGGISGAGDLLAGRVRAHLPDFTWPMLMRRAEVALAELGNDAGLLGAAALAFDEVGR
jgi:glucokinase